MQSSPAAFYSESTSLAARKRIKEVAYPYQFFFSSLRVDMLGGKRLNKGMSQMYRVNKCHIL